MRNNRFIDAIALVAIVTAATAACFELLPVPPTANRSLHGTIGRNLAEQTLRLLGPNGRITLITRDTEAFRQPALEILRRGFEQTLAASSAKVTSTKQVQTDPLRPVDVPPGDFYEALRTAKNGDVVVSLLGPPLLTEEQRIKLGAGHGKVVAFCPGPLGDQIDLEQLSQANLLHSAIVARKLVRSGRTPKEPVLANFDGLYSVLGPSELSSKPERTGPSPVSRP